MRRGVRFISGLAVCVVSASVLSAGAAGATTSSVSASTIAAHGLGAHRSTALVAPRTAHFRALDVLPASVDLKPWAVTPGNQGQVSSCVTWAINYGMLGWYSRYNGIVGQPFAPMYTYSQINGGVDAGSYPTSALEVAKTQGSDTRAHYSHNDYDWRTKPNASEKANAAKFKIKGYTTLFAGSGQAGSATLIKQALATKHPVAIEMAVRRGFDYLGANPNAVDDDITSTIRGYHEVLAVGYDAAGLIIENSWGTGWGNGGFGRLSWRVVTKDVWEADTIEGFVTPPPTPPKVAVPTVALQSSGTGANPVTTYKATWKGTAGTSGAITKYEAWSQVDGGALKPVDLATLTSVTLTLATKSGHSYRVAIRPSAGSVAGEIVYSAAFGPPSSKKPAKK
jgi:hypothetical protein